MMEGGSASLPPMSSLARFLPEVGAPATERGRLYPLDRAWAHHGANNYYQGYDQALRRLHGEPESVADYCWKGHLVTADQHRSIFEAVNHRLWDITSGMTQWKINACEPSVQWQLFDWYHKPMVSWFYAKKATEPLHVQLNLPDRMVSIINTRLAGQRDLEVRARVFGLDAGLLWEKTAQVAAPANAYQEAFAVPEPSAATAVFFVKLELRDAGGRLVSDNFYWLRARGIQDYRVLQSLPPVRLASTCRVQTEGAEKVARVKVTNPTGQIAFFVQLALTQGRDGAEILPVLWDDNYFSLLPGESREVTAVFAAEDTGKNEPTLEVGGWNVESDFDCAELAVMPKEVKTGESFIVTANISRTFLDGSRVALWLDGRPVAFQRAWSRAGQKEALRFPLTLEQAGRHEIVVGGQRVSVTVQP